MRGRFGRIVVAGSSWSRTLLEGAIGEGENPVGEEVLPRCCMIVSTAGHAKSGGKQGRPRPKAKYQRRPIANQYREGKVKSTPIEGSERDPETVCFRPVGASIWGDGVPFVE